MVLTAYWSMFCVMVTMGIIAEGKVGNIAGYISLFISHPKLSVEYVMTMALVFRVSGGWFLFYPAFFTSIWLWLYAGSGFILKAARRFDIGFGWFNQHLDIEKKPLQSIGLVAGVLVAMAYWAAVIVSKVVG